MLISADLSRPQQTAVVAYLVLFLHPEPCTDGQKMSENVRNVIGNYNI